MFGLAGTHNGQLSLQIYLDSRLVWFSAYVVCRQVGVSLVLGDAGSCYRNIFMCKQSTTLSEVAKNYFPAAAPPHPVNVISLSVQRRQMESFARRLQQLPQQTWKHGMFFDQKRVEFEVRESKTNSLGEKRLQARGGRGVQKGLQDVVILMIISLH